MIHGMMKAMCHTTKMEISSSGGEMVKRKGGKKRERERKERNEEKKEDPTGFGDEKRERRK